jgi:alpha-beta hydrolase superfamily lysophospholipase
MDGIIKQKPMKKLLSILVTVVIIFVIIIGVMIAFPPPKSLPTLEAIAAPFRSIDFSKVPDPHYYTAREGSKLAYRVYFTQHAKQIVVLVHGSSGSSLSMYPLAEYLQKQGMTVYSPDIRGHGNSARKGDIDYIGQLENDMEDFVNQVLKQHEATLVGFSLGGGFVLRFAASTRQKLFSRYVLLSPYIGYNSPTVKPKSGGWADPSYSRIVGILLLGSIGQKIFGHLPVITYAIDPRTARYQVAQYSFRLLRNFSPHFNYRADIASVKQSLTVLVGEKDELFNGYAFEPLFTESRPGTKVIVVPDVGHITLTTSLSGISAIAKAVAHE